MKHAFDEITLNQVRNNTVPRQSEVQVFWDPAEGGLVILGADGMKKKLVTAPVLFEAEVVPMDTEAALSMISSEDGTIWWSVTEVATRTAAQIKAGTGAIDNSSAACVAGVAYAPSAVGLSNGTTYYLHVVAENAEALSSRVVNTAGFVPVAP